MGISVALGGPFSAVSQPGAGRYRDYCFPEPAFLVASLTQTVSGRRPGSDGSTGFPLFGRAVYTADPGSNILGPTAYNGVNVATMLSGAAAGQSNACICLVPRLNPSFIATDEIAYTRIIWLMAIGNAPGAVNTDFGGYVVQAASATPDMRLMSGGILGFGFQFPSLTSVQFVVRGPNGLVTLAMPSITDSTILHAYELRILPPTSTQFAQLQAFVDGAPLALPALSASWAVGTNLPPLAILGGKLGFAVGAVNNSLAAANLLIQQLRVINAPTLADLF
jgi:hypothetical protein